MTTPNASNLSIEANRDGDIIQAVFVNIPLILFVCGGNLLTMVAILKNERLQTIPNMYIFSLAVSDFLVGLVLPSQSLLVSFSYMRNFYFTRKYVCLSNLLFLRIPLALSLCCIVLVSCDRYLYIVKPFFYTRITVKSVKISVAFCWIIGAFYGSIIYFHNNWDDEVGCVAIKVLSKGYNLYSVVVMFLSASFITILCYMLIIRTAIRQRREICALSIGESTSKRLEMRKNLRLVKMFAVVFGIFFVCWLPTILNLYFVYTNSHPGKIFDLVTRLLIILNSGSNCYVYAWMDKNFRAVFKQLICKC